MPIFGDDGTNFIGFREVARAGSLAMVHAEKQQVARALHEERAGGSADLAAWSRHSPDWAEAVRRSAFFTAETGARLHVVHLTSG